MTMTTLKPTTIRLGLMGLMECPKPGFTPYLGTDGHHDWRSRNDGRRAPPDEHVHELVEHPFLEVIRVVRHVEPGSEASRQELRDWFVNISYDVHRHIDRAPLTHEWRGGEMTRKHWAFKRWVRRNLPAYPSGLSLEGLRAKRLALLFTLEVIEAEVQQGEKAAQTMLETRLLEWVIEERMPLTIIVDALVILQGSARGTVWKAVNEAFWKSGRKVYPGSKCKRLDRM
jgi:hypothetical protein